jgi:predicted metal-dependent hydrolase
MANNRTAGTGAGDDGVIIEFHRVGNAVKVSAVDPQTFLEVSIIAPLNASEREMTQTVLRKLAWVKSKDAALPKGKGR